MKVEDQILGCILIDGSTLKFIIDKIRPEMFRSESNRIVYKTCLNLFSESKPIDLVTVTTEIYKAKLQEKVSPTYLSALTSHIASTANVEHYVELLTINYIKIKSLEHVNKFIEESGISQFDDIKENINDLVSNLTSLSSQNSKQTKHISDIIKESLSTFDKALKGEVPEGFSTGLNCFDDEIGTLCAPDLIIIAARPGMGKTAFALNIAHHAALELSKSVAFFSLEMSSSQLVTRLQTIRTAINGVVIKNPLKYNITDNQINRIDEESAILSESQLFIDDTPGLSIIDLRAKALRLKAMHNIDLLIVDYLQLMNGKGSTRDGEISDISRGLKLIAKELDIPVIALSQLNRAVELRQDKKPQLSDLRESGSIEQDADKVVFLWSPSYYDINTIYDKNGEEISTENYCQLIAAKNRSGATSKVHTRFIPEFMKFEDYNPF